MQGSLDAPPIVIRTSRMANAIGFIVCAAMAYFRIYIFAVGVLYFGWQLLDSNALILAPDGLTLKNSFKRRHWAWNEVSNFRPMSVGQFGWDVNGKSHGSFGFGWEIGTGKLAALLNAARARWLHPNP